ncbi:MAG: hypothetical protein Q8L05_09360, partial [Actinomycetota bacterium]|nr:hypothetical protein [Actinomycetota bacterium]
GITVATIDVELHAKLRKPKSVMLFELSWTHECALFVFAGVTALMAYLAAALGAMTQATDRSPSAFACYWAAGIFAFSSAILVMVALIVASRSAQAERVDALNAASLNTQ